MKRIIAASAAITAVLGGSFLAAPPASTSPVITGGLVNVTIVDVIDDVTVTLEDINVGVALGLAANVCDTTVGVLSQQLQRDGTTSCTADGQTVTLNQD